MKPESQLMEQLASPENLLNAWRIVRGNIPSYRRQHSSGPDGITINEFERDLTTQLFTLRSILIKGRYQPTPPGLIQMKKQDGGIRTIAILNVSDRVVQRAAQQVLEPIFEKYFLPCSFGYRPGRSIQDAIYCVQRLRQNGYGWVVDGDIAACFDSLDHQILIKMIRKPVQDVRLIDLIEKWLESGILEYCQPTNELKQKPLMISKATKGMQQGLDWVMDSLPISQKPKPYYEEPPDFSQSNEPDRYNSYPEDYTENNPYGDDYKYPQHYDDTKNETYKNAIRQIATGGFVLGSDWLRRQIPIISPILVSKIKSMAGQEIIKQGLLLGGGTVGAVIGLSLSSYFIYRHYKFQSQGIMQGSPLSPLLSNVYLHAFDHSLTKAGYRLIRFADDWVILCPDEHCAEIAYNQSIVALSKIHLKINPEKTRILSPGEQFEWLGEVIS